MAGASFLSGMLPLYFPLSSRQLRLVSALGTGVLVGTALIIIIPEGVETLYSSSEGSHSHDARSLSLAPRMAVSAPITFPASLKHDTWRRDAQIEEDTALPNDLGVGTGQPVHDDLYVEHATEAQELENLQRQQEEDENDGADNSAGDSQENQEQDNPSTGDDEADTSSSTRDPHAYVGISLIAGFILMYLIDTLPKQYLSRSQPQRFQISLNNLSFNNSNNNNIRADSISSMDDNLPPPLPQQHNTHHTSSSSTTTGLVIHACADGIALGASSTTTSRLTFIIFIALIVHKAPAAFGLTSVLLRQGLGKRTARAHLIVFALAAPAGAILTWLAAHLLGYSSAAMGESMSTEFATGVLLLFSGGTFLYVAVHTMQESSHGETHGGGAAHMNGYSGVAMSDLYESSASAAASAQAAKGVGMAGGGGKVGDTLLTCAGMLLPLLLNFGHGH